MKKAGYIVLFCMTALLAVLLSGCAQGDHTSSPAETSSNNPPIEEESGQTMETSEYETKELYTKRDENQIYGLIYVPKDAGEKMPAVIFSHGFGGNYQVGTQYAEALVQTRAKRICCLLLRFLWRKPGKPERWLHFGYVYFH